MISVTIIRLLKHIETVSRTGTAVAPDDMSTKRFCCWLQVTKKYNHMCYIRRTEIFISLKFFFSIFTFKLLLFLYLLYRHMHIKAQWA